MVLSYENIHSMFDAGLFSGIKDMATELGMSIVLGSLLFMVVLVSQDIFSVIGVA